MGHHRAMPDLTRPQAENAVPCGLVRRHAAWVPGNLRGASPEGAAQSAPTQLAPGAPLIEAEYDPPWRPQPNPTTDGTTSPTPEPGAGWRGALLSCSVAAERPAGPRQPVQVRVG